MQRNPDNESRQEQRLPQQNAPVNPSTSQDSTDQPTGIQLPETPSIELPKGGGAIAGIGEKFKANPVTGTGSFSIPIAMSPGRDLTPQLGLSYNSGSGNSPFGLGWNVGLPSITRKTDKGMPTYEDNLEKDTFILNGGEDLVPKLDETTPGNWERDVRDEPSTGTATHTVTRYRPRTEGTFARIERWEEKSSRISHWRTTSAENVTTIYGESANSRITHPNDAAKVFQWLIERTYDSKGNVVAYNYVQENDQGVDAQYLHEKNRLKNGPTFPHRYLKSVKYGNTTMYSGTGALPADWHFQLVFDYGEHDQVGVPTLATPNAWPVRQDPFSTYRAGFELRKYRLCKRVLMFHKFSGVTGFTDFTLVKSTDLTFNENTVATQLSSVTHRSYNGSTAQAVPAVNMTYTQATLDETLYDFDVDDLENLPGGVDGQQYVWQDLDGEGLTGILTEDTGGWFYKRNLGDESYYQDYPVSQTPPPDIRFGTLETVAQKPSVGTVAQLTDIDGDGQAEMVLRSGTVKGFFERDEEGEWQPFTAFEQAPNIDWRDPNLRMIDLNGDGRADVLITEDQCFRWYPSLAKQGFDDAKTSARFLDEEQGPALVFADGTQSIFLTDMSGDGLTDICRICNGAVCYWPNMGYGRFGAKVGMDNAPRFDFPEGFDPSRIRLSDVDGSGTTDIIYLGAEKVAYWSNNSGNSFSLEKEILNFPKTDNLTAVQALDLFGKGIACLVWSSPLPGDEKRRIRYIDLMGNKPYLLAEVNNNMGAISRMHYAPSTKFYLRDRQEGRPWVTRLPFPVQVVERTEIYDEITGQRYVSRYAYHHGYYDRFEREFRGFGMVEQWDTEQFEFFIQPGLFQVGTNALDEESHIPPLHTKTWFHNGFYENRKKITDQYASEYFDQDTNAFALVLNALPAGLTAAEEREAHRALRGQKLRSEVYTDDQSALAALPYSVTESSSTVRLIQPSDGEKQAVFQVIPNESISYQYERDVDDPRVSQKITLATDPTYGTVIKSASIAYPRRKPQGTDTRHEEQKKGWVSYSTSTIFHVDGDTDPFYRLGVTQATKAYEAHNLSVAYDTKVTKNYLTTQIITNTPSEIGYDDDPGTSGVKLRLLAHQTGTYYNDDASAELPVGQVGKHGLPYQSKSLVYTGNMIANTFNQGTVRVTDTIMQNDGYYEKIGTDWWDVSGTSSFDNNNFFVLSDSTDRFGSTTTITYDAFFLFPVSSQNELGNTVSSKIDYRVLSPWEMTDANGNRQQIGFDTLGMVTKTAVMGKVSETLGDTLSDPTQKMAYDLFNWQNNGEPNFVKTEARETHGGSPVWQTSYAYSNGMGQIVLEKSQAEPGEAFQRDGNGDLVLDGNNEPILQHTSTRWVGNGRTIVNNKGGAVKQYEPYFSSTHAYETETEVREYGVTSILSYDSLGRNVRTDFPDGTFTKVEFDVWLEKNFDTNDTVRDSDWYTNRNSPNPTGGEPSDPNERAAWLAAQHHNTPKNTHLDSLGRVFLTQDDNGTDGSPDYIDLRVEMDIEGKGKKIINDLGQETVFAFSMRPKDKEGNAEILYTHSPDGGWRRTLVNVAENPIYAWSERGFNARNEYDELQRPTSAWVDDGSGEKLIGLGVYGDNIGLSNPEVNNFRGQAIRTFDQSGVMELDVVDFKGNVLESTKKLASNYQTVVDWVALDGLTTLSSIDTAAASALDSETFTTVKTVDALNRPLSVKQPDGTEHKPTFNEANLLNKVEVKLAHEGGFTTYVENIDYDEKGQRTRIEYGNNTRTDYTYDPDSYRLVRLYTNRNGSDVMQDLNYTYDALGNITELTDNAQQTHYFNNTVIAPTGKYRYDALSRVVSAQGREKVSLAAPGSGGYSPFSISPGGKSSETLSTYCESYAYDSLGNLLSLSHKDTCNGTENWRRTYVYNATPPYTALSDNYLQSAYTGSTAPSSPEFTYDAHGNLLKMPHLSSITWDHADQMKSSVKGNDTTHYVYSGGERVRKVVTDTHGNISYERIYLGGYEIYKKYNAGTLDIRRESNKVMDDQKMVALLEVKTIDGGTTVGSPTTIARYQYTNHLDSASLELDENADVISYEEFHPFGTTAYAMHTNDNQVADKRYRYVHKERDEETGLYYYGARYYAPWLCRFTSVDPLKDTYPHLNPYNYAGNKPVNWIDIDGMQGEAEEETGELLTFPTNEEFDKAFQKAVEYAGEGTEITMESQVVDGHFQGYFTVKEGEDTITVVYDEDNGFAYSMNGSDLKKAVSDEEGNLTPSEQPLPDFWESRKSYAAGSGAIGLHDGIRREQYLRAVKEIPEVAIKRIDAAEAAGDLPAAEQAARDAVDQRNTTRKNFQAKQSPSGQASSVIIEQERTYEGTKSKPKNQGSTPFETERNVARSAGKSNVPVNRISRGLGILSILATIYGIWEISEAYDQAPTPAEKERVLYEEGYSLGYGTAGGIMGGVAASAAVAFVGGLLAVTPVGWVVLGAVFVGSMIGGAIGSEYGRSRGREMYEQEQEKRRNTPGVGGNRPYEFIF